MLIWRLPARLRSICLRLTCLLQVYISHLIFFSHNKSASTTNQTNMLLVFERRQGIYQMFIKIKMRQTWKQQQQNNWWVAWQHPNSPLIHPAKPEPLETHMGAFWTRQVKFLFFSLFWALRDSFYVFYYIPLCLIIFLKKIVRAVRMLENFILQFTRVTRHLNRFVLMNETNPSNSNFHFTISQNSYHLIARHMIGYGQMKWNSLDLNTDLNTGFVVLETVYTQFHPDETPCVSIPNYVTISSHIVMCSI
jgi:hypothetical protein